MKNSKMSLVEYLVTPCVIVRYDIITYLLVCVWTLHQL